jgi:hypothetical protein
MSQPDPLLFGPNSLTDSLRNNEERMLREIDAIDGDEFLNTSADALCDYFVERFKVEPPILRDGDIQVDSPSEVELNPADPRVGLEHAGWDLLARRERQAAGGLGRALRGVGAHPAAALEVALSAEDAAGRLEHALAVGVGEAGGQEVVHYDGHVRGLVEQPFQRVAGRGPRQRQLARGERAAEVRLRQGHDLGLEAS